MRKKNKQSHRRTDRKNWSSVWGRRSVAIVSSARRQSRQVGPCGDQRVTHSRLSSSSGSVPKKAMSLLNVSSSLLISSSSLSDHFRHETCLIIGHSAPCPVPQCSQKIIWKLRYWK